MFATTRFRTGRTNASSAKQRRNCRSRKGDVAAIHRLKQELQAEAPRTATFVRTLPPRRFQCMFLRWMRAEVHSRSAHFSLLTTVPTGEAESEVKTPQCAKPQFTATAASAH
jgi:hypothetical protein